ncbi:unnamed protein product [Urochloa humidicola]
MQLLQAPTPPRGRARGTIGGYKSRARAAGWARPSLTQLAVLGSTRSNNRPCMDAQAKRPPATARSKDDPRRPHGGERPAERVEGGGDGASRSTARREAEQAAAAVEAKGADQPLPHERVPQPRDVYNEQLERL